MAEVIPQINIDSTKIKDTWTEKEYVTDEVYNALNKTVIDLKNNNNLLDSNSILFREEYNSSSKNLNNAIHQGVYSFTNSAVNAPSGVTGGNLFVTNTSKINQGSSVITQIAFCHNGAVYARTKNTSENFTSWNKLAYITDNVASATKASQDSQGQAINTTYVKGVTASNSNLIITKGNGTTSTVTIIQPGTILPFAGNTIPAGYLACNGAAISRTTYSTLYNVIGTTYGAGNGSSTFNVPAIEDNRFLEFSSTRGTKKNAGLPDIYAWWCGAYEYESGMAGDNKWGDGAVTTNRDTYNTIEIGDTPGDGKMNYNFHASRYNAIYGSSNTVQPKSLTVRAIIKY